MFRKKSLLSLTILLTFTVLFTGCLGQTNRAPALPPTETGTDVIVKVGQMGADTYTQSMNGVLYTENQIGLMADRILWTEAQIGLMADRIVYVTEFSQDNSIKVIYMVTSLWKTGEENGGYTYKVALTPVAALPAGW